MGLVCGLYYDVDIIAAASSAASIAYDDASAAARVAARVSRTVSVYDPLHPSSRAFHVTCVFG